MNMAALSRAYPNNNNNKILEKASLEYDNDDKLKKNIQETLDSLLQSDFSHFRYNS